jgi:CRP/FNR family transcriptional regulator
LLLGEAQRAGVRSAKAVTFELTLTHQQIASRIGSVREVVSRAFARLQQHELIRVESRNVTIVDEKAFSIYALD